MLLNQELITNGNFAAWDSVGARVEDPTDWIVVGEVTTDPEISEVGTGEGHGGSGTGMCNLYSSDGTTCYSRQVLSGLIVGRRYRFSINVDTIIAGTLKVYDNGLTMMPSTLYNTTGIKTFYFVATATTFDLRIFFLGSVATDITFDDVSIRPIAETDLSRTGQYFSSHQEM